MDRLTVRDLLRDLLGVPTSPIVLQVGGAPNTAFSVLRNDPSRVSFLMVNTGPSPVFVVPQAAGQPSSLNGVRIEPNGGALSVMWRDDGEVTGWEWLGISLGTPGTMLTVSNVIIPGDQPHKPAAGGA